MCIPIIGHTVIKDPTVITDHTTEIITTIITATAQETLTGAMIDIISITPEVVPVATTDQVIIIINRIPDNTREKIQDISPEITPDHPITTPNHRIILITIIESGIVTGIDIMIVIEINTQTKE